MSTVTCSHCHTSTRTEDPFLDVSLEMKAGVLGEKPVVNADGTLSLIECLRRSAVSRLQLARTRQADGTDGAQIHKQRASER